MTHPDDHIEAPQQGTAVHAALELHQPYELGKALVNASADEIARWKHRNAPRASLLNDSWAHKGLAFRQFLRITIHSAITVGDNEDLLRHEPIITEEWKEFWEAVTAGDLIETLDGALDLVYTVIDFLVAMGYPPALIRDAYEEIHASNMTKCDDDGNPVLVNGKVQKTPNYTKPNLAAIFQRYNIPLPAQG